MRLVSIGGGKGQSNILAGLKTRPYTITAIVPATDSGGSTEVFRSQRQIVAAGDITRNMLALSDLNPGSVSILDHRVGYEAVNKYTLRELIDLASEKLGVQDTTDITDRFDPAILDGSVRVIEGWPPVEEVMHPLRNILYVSAVEYLADVPVYPRSVSRLRDLQSQALQLMNDALCRPHAVFPVSCDYTNLISAYMTGDLLCMEHVIDSGIGGQFQCVSDFGLLQTENVVLMPQARDAILEAEIMSIGPGSFFTSLLATLIIPRLAELPMPQRIFYISNIMNSIGEDSFVHPRGFYINFTLNAHLRLLSSALGHQITDVLWNSPSMLICDNVPDDNVLYAHFPSYLMIKKPVPDVRIYADRLSRADDPDKHDPHKVAALLQYALQDKI